MKYEKYKNLIKAVVFLIILFCFFLFFTYLFRNTLRHTRQNILEYYEEEENSLDVVFIGSSNVIKYYDPMYAWNKYGFASYSYGTSEMSPATFLAAIKDVLKTQNPTVVVVEARGFVGNKNNITEVNVGARNFFDSIDYDWFRLKEVYKHCKRFNIPWDDAVTLYIDLMHYHDNYAALITEENWELADNRLGEEIEYGRMYKGFSQDGTVAVFDDPSEKISEGYREVSENSIMVYKELIEYCQENEIPLLFVATPIVSNKGTSERYNTVAQIAESYGVDFLDTNKLYAEMGLDFAQDFRDKQHTNILGATKFTDYFGSYLVENYDLPDHREESEYAEWNQLYNEYIVKADKERAKIQEIIAVHDKAFEAEALMKETSDVFEWLNLADNSEITLFIASNGKGMSELEPESELALQVVGITDEFLLSENAYSIIYNNEVMYSDYADTEKTGTVGYDKVEYVLTDGKKPQILIDETGYFDDLKDGIQIVAFDNNTSEVVDVICISKEGNGTLVLEHVTN